MLIQSGADIPDGELVAEMERYYRVSVFSGAPDHDAGDAGSIYISDKNYANALQSAAEQGGIDHIVCVWGFVEDLRDRKAGKTISWVPILGSIVPDEEQHMSIRLKVAVVDVRTGRWDIFSPPVYDTSRFSSHITREDVDQEQVSSLKGQAYYAAVGALQTRLSAR
ncbi:MAG: hypothetical protein O2910_00710 [Proteobacteria bacterium]|nr:hypothetical protein [Pseudomonadota bacterium]